MKKGIIFLIVIIILILTISINVYRAQGDNENVEVNVTQLTEKQLRSTVMIPGTLKLADEQYVYYDTQKGELDNIHVTEGSRVQYGTPVVTYENDALELEKEQNKLAKKSSQLHIDSLNKQLNNLNKKQKELEKQVSKEEAKEQIASERTQLNVDLETAKIELEKNKLDMKSTAKKEADLEVKSEINGTVLEVNKEAVNNTSDVQKPLAHIGNTDQYLASGMLSEYDALNVKSGQPVTITSDVVPNKKWTGTVKQIGYLPQQQAVAADASGAGDAPNQYPVEIKIDDEDIKSMKPGFKLLLEIETNSQTAKSIPAKSIVNEDKKTYVFVVKDGKALRREVKIGQRTNKFVEIVKGISAKDKVVTNPSDQLTDGVEVNVQ